MQKYKILWKNHYKFVKKFGFYKNIIKFAFNNQLSKFWFLKK